MTASISSISNRRKVSPLKLAGLGLLASASVLGATSFVPANAQTSPIDQVEEMVTNVGGIATAAVAVVLGAMGARVAIKLVNRVAVKG